jgi:hypothetical protein
MENHKARLAHAVKMNRTADLSKILLFKDHQMPEGHPFIWDNLAEGGWRRCQSNEEILRGTWEIHSEWCGSSKAKEFFFGTVVNDAVDPANRLE